MYIMLPHLLDLDDSEGHRGVARRADRRDITLYRVGLSRTVCDLRHDVDFRHVFGGAVNTPKQLGLASPKEAFTLPADPQARLRFFSRLEHFLCGPDGFGLTSRGDSPGLMTVLKGINQKHAVYHRLTPPEDAIATNLVDFAHGLAEEVGSVVSAERCSWEISVDLAVTMSPVNAARKVIVAPRGD
ncbi:unnamed protein product, partial [Pylaiella littoralis]